MNTEELRRIHPHSFELCKKIAEISPTIFLAFSCGKDSICVYLELLKHGVFEKIIPYYMYLVPDISFVNKALDYYEDYFKTHIYRIPHPSLYRWLNNLTYQAPENCKIIESALLPDFDFDDICKYLCEDLNLKGDVFCANGVRACDSPVRRMVLQKHGPVNYNKKTFMPIWDWNKKDVYKCLTENNIDLPVDYKIFGRSFDGIDYRFLKPIKENFPEDYKKIKSFFPLVDLEIFRRDCFRKHIKKVAA